MIVYFFTLSLILLSDSGFMYFMACLYAHILVLSYCNLETLLVSYNCSTGKHKSGKMKSKPKDPSKRHQLFKKRFA